MGAPGQADRHHRPGNGDRHPPRGASDHIEDTIDYKKVAKRLLAFVGESQFNLSRRSPRTSRAWS
jgi:hypothetical protein